MKLLDERNEVGLEEARLTKLTPLKKTKTKEKNNDMGGLL